MGRAWALGMLVVAAAGGAPRGQEPDAARRPNILLAIADDWGYPHAGAYGDAVVRTPSFDRIAAEGVVFEHAYAAFPTCSASRAAIVTGLMPWRLGPGANLYGPIPEELGFYTDALAAAGWFVGYERKGWGPGRLPHRDRNPAGPRFDGFAAFLEARPEGRPFAFWLGSSDPHRPYDELEGEDEGIDPGAIRLPPVFPDAPEVRADVADYYAEVQRFDAEVGAALALLEARGELDDTLVVVTGDHGMPFPRCKADFLYVRNLRPDRWPAGTPDPEKAWYRGSWYGNVDNGPTKTYMVEQRDRDARHRRLFEAAFAKRPAEELYDLRADPAQLEDRARDPSHAASRAALADRLDARLRQTGDPRAAGEGAAFDDYPYAGGSPLHPGFDSDDAGPPDRGEEAP